MNRRLEPRSLRTGRRLYMRPKKVVQTELEGYKYSEMSTFVVQNFDLETSQYCEENDLETTVKHKRTDPERGRDN